MNEQIILILYMEVLWLGEEYKYHDPCREGYDQRKDQHRHHEETHECHSCEPCGSCYDHDNDWDWGSWLPILIVVFILCGGFGWFTGGGKDDCYDGGGSGGWLLIILVIFLVWQGQGDGKKGGFLGGLF